MDQVAWQGPAIAAGVSAIGAAVLWWLKRHADLAHELRKALDRGRIRENALAVCCELLVYAIDHFEGEPSKAVLELRARALVVLEDARRLTHGKGDK